MNGLRVFNAAEPSVTVGCCTLALLVMEKEFNRPSINITWSDRIGLIIHLQVLKYDGFQLFKALRLYCNSFESTTQYGVYCILTSLYAGLYYTCTHTVKLTTLHNYTMPGVTLHTPVTSL